MSGYRRLELWALRHGEAIGYHSPRLNHMNGCMAWLPYSKSTQRQKEPVLL
jgi:hypothetical protein